MADLGQAAARNAARRQEEQGQLIGFARRIARSWAGTLEVDPNAVQWVAVKGGCRTPISLAETTAVIHCLENDAGIAFILGSPGVMDLLFVVRSRGTTYSVNISNAAQPWDRSETFNVRPDLLEDIHRLLASAARYARRAAA